MHNSTHDLSYLIYANVLDKMPYFCLTSKFRNPQSEIRNHFDLSSLIRSRTTDNPQLTAVICFQTSVF